MQNNVEIIQINISGEDKPGMTSSLTEILARYDAFILDIGQAMLWLLSGKALNAAGLSHYFPEFCCCFCQRQQRKSVRRMVSYWR